MMRKITLLFVMMIFFLGFSQVNTVHHLQEETTVNGLNENYSNQSVSQFSNETIEGYESKLSFITGDSEKPFFRNSNLPSENSMNIVTLGGSCLSWLNPTPTTGWVDFNLLFNGAPTEGAGCPFNEIDDFEVWASEAYTVDNFVAGVEYTFSMCNGPGAGSWVPDFTIIAPSGVVDAFGLGDGDGCSITWTASESGTYLIVINEDGACGGGTNTATDNGFPALTCTGGGGGGGSFPAPYCGPLVFASDVEPITLVEVAGISNVSSAVINGSPAHEDFTAIVGNMEPGESYDIALEGNTGGNWTTSFTVFIDWNQDGVLDNDTERYEIGAITNSTGTDGQQATGTIVVPADALNGETRMRVIKRFQASYATDSCTPGSGFGQAEDYTIMVGTTSGPSSVIIDFDGEDEFTPGNGYGPHQITVGGFEWSFNEALSPETPLANDWFNDVRSARFRGRNGSALTMLEDKSNGLGEITFLYRRYGTDGAQQPWAVEYSVNEGVDWTQVGDTFIATDDVQTFNETVNVEGDVRIRIVIASEPGTTGNRRMNIDDIELTDFTVAPVFARAQIIHNSADPIAEFVDIYVNDDLYLANFEFRTSTPFVDIPANVPLSIDIAPAGSTSSGDSIYNLTATLDEGETYLVIATGVVDPSQFDETVNSPIDFRLEVYAGARETANDPTEVDVLVHHGSTDAPTVDVVETSVPVGIIVDDISFPEFQGYLELIAGDYEIDITNEDGTVVVASYGVPLTSLGLEGGAITVLASGFLDPSTNQDGAAFGLWVSLAAGGALVELPLLSGIPNEECANAIALTCGDVVTGTTAGATNSGGNASPDVFYSYTGSGTPEFVTISLCDGGTTYDSFLRVYESCDDLSLGNELILNDDFCGLQSQLTFESDGTTTYIIMVEGFGTSAGDYSLAITCEPNLPPACGGIFTDSGGVDGNYNNNEDITWTISPDNPDDFVTVIFSEFDVEATWDALYVFDGPDTSSPLISSGNPPTNSGFPAGGWYGTTIPGPFASTHPTGALTFRFLSDSSVTRPGWVADVVCLPVPPPNDLIQNAISVTNEPQAYTDPAVRLQYATNELLNPEGCAIAGTNGVWYSFTASIDGTAEASITTPAGTSAVIFYESPNENVGDETDLTFNFESSNQCAPGVASSITTTAGQSYYIFVLNTGGPSDVVIDISGSLSTIDNVIDGFVMYPNPATNVLNLNSNISIDTVEVYNMLGQKVLSQSIDATSTQLDVRGLSIGNYLIRVTAEGQTATYQFVKK